MNVKEKMDEWRGGRNWKSPIMINGFSRRHLIQQFNEFGFKRGAEIGVDRGRFSQFMCAEIPGLKLLCIDPWHWRFHGESRYESAKKRLKGYNSTLDRRTSIKAFEDVKDRSLDFIYIDGNHTFDFAMIDLIVWTQKVKYGGIVAGHDYYRFGKVGVIDAVDKYTEIHKIDNWFITNHRKDKTPSFFWMREKKHDWDRKIHE